MGDKPEHSINFAIQSMSFDALSTIVEETEGTSTILMSLAEPPSLARNETLETSPMNRAEHAIELSNILGDARAHLQKLSGKEQLDPDNGKLQPLFWEQYSPHAQVELDIDLESNVAVQGDCFRGHVLINVNPQEPLLVGVELGKIRLLGLEWLSKDDERSVFYSFSSPLLLAAPGIRALLTSEPNEHGFSMISPGSFSVPFALQIPTSPEFGIPKGRFSKEGISVRTVVLVTLRVKYPVSQKQSIAHFFRECVLWPRVDPQKVLHAETRPIQVTTSEDDIHLTASLYPPTWVAGQDCRIRVVISNSGQSSIKTLDISLFNTITIFRPQPCQPGKEDEHTSIQISKASLKAKQLPVPGHASAKGWWPGVKPGETRTVYHSIPIPPDALSVVKGNLFEVTTFIRIVLPRGILLSNVSVDLPLVIVNAQSFRVSELTTPHPPPAIPDVATSHVVQMNALRLDRDNLNNKSAANIQLAGNDQETSANNRPQVNDDDHTANNILLGLSTEHPHFPQPLHFSPEIQAAGKMPPPYLTNFARRVEEKRQQLIKLRSLQAEEYDSELLEDLDLHDEHISSISQTRVRRSSSDSSDSETRTATASRSPSPEPDEPFQTEEHEDAYEVIVNATEAESPTATRSEDDSNVNIPKETSDRVVEQVQLDVHPKPGRIRPVTEFTSKLPVLAKRTGSDRDTTKPLMIPKAPPKFLTSNEAASNSLKASSSFTSSGQIPKLGAVKERIKALEMRAAE